jgi:enoyl-CoA hydratase
MQHLVLERDGAVALVTVNRPDKLNALNAALLDELEHTIGELHADDRTRAVVVTGAGVKAFVAGADIAELAGLDALTGRATARRGQRIFRALELLPKPVIAAVNGFALGGGCELALACHIRLASENASFGLPEVGLGVIPGYGGTQRLARLVGRGRALEMVLTGQRIGADEALRIGLVNRVVPQEKLLEAARGLTATILDKGPVAVGAAVEAIQRGIDMPLDEALAFEACLFGVVCGTEDMREGMAAFLEKRKPEFRNR